MAVNSETVTWLCTEKQHTPDSAAYMSQTQDQKRFTISEVAADWHRLMILQCTMWIFIACMGKQLDTVCS